MMKSVIVGVDQIPKVEDVKDVPLDNPIEVYKLCREMEDICEREEGIGLSAAQLGVPWKLFVMKSNGFPLVPKGEYGYFVNCDYEATTTEQVVSLEGCLSVRSQDGQLRLFQVKRYTKIKLYGYILDNKLRFFHVDCDAGFSDQAVVLQHEIDHHRGILISDLGEEIFVY